MPTPAQILQGLTAVANGARGLAVAWHVALAALLVAFASGWRPSRRLLGALLALPLFSVAALAGAYGNPFNLGVPAAFGVALVALAVRLPGGSVGLRLGPAGLAGLAVFGYGWVYPHFLATDSPLAYLYAAPTGLVPCPSLSVAIGLALVAGGLGSRAWSWTLAAAGLFYAFFGMFRLGVLLDVGLLFGAVSLGVVGWSRATVRAPHLK